jgi:hypothetical protein
MGPEPRRYELVRRVFCWKRGAEKSSDVAEYVLWRPAELVTARFGPAPSSRDRIDDHSVRVGPWAVAITRPAIRRRCGDCGPGRIGWGRSFDIWAGGRIGWGSSDIRRTNSSASNGSSSNRSSYCRAAILAPIRSSANASNARCRKGPSDPCFGRVQRKFCR